MSHDLHRDRAGRLSCVTATAAVLSLLGGCGTLSGQEADGALLEMRAEGAEATFSPPAHCTRPGYSATFHPGAGVLMTVAHHGGGALTTFRVELERGRTFAFATTSGRVDFPSGAPSLDAFVRGTSWLRDSRTVREVAPADGVMTGAAPAGDRSVFEGEFSVNGVTAQAFSMQFPDAVVNGVPYRLPPLHFSGRPFRYFQDACLR